jgi:hypothetical protein
MPRLPTVGGDDGQWGTVLNNFLKENLTTDGKLKIDVWNGVGSRPSSPKSGQLGLNTQTGQLERYDGSSWGPVAVKVSVNEQTGTSYTLTLSDQSKTIECNNANAFTLTVPPNSSVAFPTGTVIGIRQTGNGQVTVSEGSGVTITSKNSNLKLSTQYSEAALHKVDTDTWRLVGDITS